jgi:hypothetical protein
MDFDHPKFRFVELSIQRNGEPFLIDVDTLMVGDPELLHITGDPDLTVVGDINMEDYQKVKVRELELPPVVVGEKKKKKVLPAVPSLAQLRGKNKVIGKYKEDKEEKDSKKESKAKKRKLDRFLEDEAV